MTARGDAALMEASLIAAAGTDIRHPLFDRFLTAYPARRAAFLNLDAASRRMTDETLQLLFGLAQGETWVWPLVADLVATHRNYGALPAAEYDAFIDMAIAELGNAAGSHWTGAAAAAWARQGTALKAIVRRAIDAWHRAVPEGAASA